MAKRVHTDADPETGEVMPDISIAGDNGHADVLALIEDVERSLNRLREQAGDEAARAKEAEHLSSQVVSLESDVDSLESQLRSLENERAQLLERSIQLESHLAAARANSADADARAERALAECHRVETAATNAQITLQSQFAITLEQRADAAAEQHRSDAAAIKQLQREASERAAEAEAQHHRDAAAIEQLQREASERAAEAEAQRRSDAAAIEQLQREASERAAEAEAQHRSDAAAIEQLQREASERADAAFAQHGSAAATIEQLQREASERAAEAEAQHGSAAATIEQLQREASERAAQAEAQHRSDAAAIEQLQREASERAAEAEAQRCAHAEIVETLERAKQDALETAARLQREVQAHATALGDAITDDAEIARAAEARIQQLVTPKLAQLAQAASFLRTRKNRLAALRQGLRDRSRAMRALRQIYSQPRLDATMNTAGAPQLSGELRTEQIDIARERQELTELRSILLATEESITRRATGVRFAGTTAIVTLFLSVAAALSWHAAGVLAPPTVLATVELQATSRAPGQPEGAVVDAAPVGEWLKANLASDAFIGAVSGRLSERGRLRAESEELIANLSQRAAVDVDGSIVRVSLRGSGAETTTAALDAIATTAYLEANRLPERRVDQLKVGIANATREVGRTVFSRAETLADPSRLQRAGMLFGAFTAFAALAAGVLWLLARRAVKSEFA